MNEFSIEVLLGMRSPRMNFGGGGTPSGPTPQQVALQTEQAVTNAQLNLEENEQRKTILNALQGTRVFRGSALSRSAASTTAGTQQPFAPPAAPSSSQQSPVLAPVVSRSLLDQSVSPGAVGQVGSAVSLISNTGAGGTGRIPLRPGRAPA